ncbi:MAG TPA: hypothetical protein PK828_11325, partial [Limnochordia bacterium]|nr:hypothetical protein [Limnochordia bacterium]
MNLILIQEPSLNKNVPQTLPRCQARSPPKFDTAVFKLEYSLNNTDYPACTGKKVNLVSFWPKREAGPNLLAQPPDQLYRCFPAGFHV